MFGGLLQQGLEYSARDTKIRKKEKNVEHSIGVKTYFGSSTFYYQNFADKLSYLLD